MKLTDLIKIVEKIPNGRYFRIRYLRMLKLQKELRDEGYTAFKIVDTTSRTGVRYASLIPPSELKAATRNEETSWHWVVPNKIKYNVNTANTYLVLAPIKKGNNTKASYILINPNGKVELVQEEVMKQKCLASEFRNDKKPKVININTDNILLIK